MGISSIISRNRRVSPINNGEENIINNHKRICQCRKCRKKRRKECNTACMALCPLFGIIAILSAIG